MNTAQLALITGSVLLLAAGLVLCVALGWLQFSFSLRAVPPWNRKAGTRKEPSPAPAVTVGEALAAGAVPTTLAAVKRGPDGRFAG